MTPLDGAATSAVVGAKRLNYDVLGVVLTFHAESLTAVASFARVGRTWLVAVREDDAEAWATLSRHLFGLRLRAATRSRAALERRVALARALRPIRVPQLSPIESCDEAACPSFAENLSNVYGPMPLPWLHCATCRRALPAIPDAPKDTPAPNREADTWMTRQSRAVARVMSAAATAIISDPEKKPYVLCRLPRPLRVTRRPVYTIRVVDHDGVSASELMRYLRADPDRERMDWAEVAPGMFPAFRLHDRSAGCAHQFLFVTSTSKAHPTLGPRQVTVDGRFTVRRPSTEAADRVLDDLRNYGSENEFTSSEGEDDVAPLSGWTHSTPEPGSEHKLVRYLDNGAFAKR